MNAEYNEDDDPVEAALASAGPTDVPAADEADGDDPEADVREMVEGETAKAMSGSSLRSLATRYKPLTPQEEDGITAALFWSDRALWEEKMILHNIRFAMHMADKYFVKGESREDSVQRALLGLVRATKKYDPSLKYRFLTYAGHVMLNEYRDAINYCDPRAIMRRRTHTVMDKPLSDDADCDQTSADRISTSQCDPTHDPSSLTGIESKVREADDGNALVDFLRQRLRHFMASRFQNGTDEEKKLSYDRVRMLFEMVIVGGMSIPDLALVVGVSGERLRQTIRKMTEFFRHDREIHPGIWADWAPFFARTPKPVEAGDRTVEQFDEAEMRRLRLVTLPYLSERYFDEYHARRARRKRGKKKQTGVVRDEENWTEEILAEQAEGYRTSRVRTSDWAKFTTSSQNYYERKRNVHRHYKPWYGGFYSEYNRLKLMNGGPPCPYLEGEELYEQIRLGNISPDDCRRLSSGRLFWSMKTKTEDKHV